MTTPCCRCGSRMVMNDNHYICERYLEEIKNGIEEMRALIEELEAGGV